MRTWQKPFLATAALGLFCFLLYYPQDQIGYYADDLHLLRSYSYAEMRQGWTGNWEPDGIENPAYRPLYAPVLYAQYGMFKDAPVPHRFFLMALWVMTSAAAIYLFGLFGVPLGVGLLSAVIWMATVYNVQHIAQLGCGNHVIQMACVISSGICLIHAVRANRPLVKTASFLGSVLMGLVATLMREDSLVMLAVVASLPALDAFMKRAEWSTVFKRLLIYGAWIIFGTVLFFIVRAWAIHGVATPYEMHPDRLLYSLIRLVPGFFTFDVQQRILGLLFFGALLFELANQSSDALFLSLYLLMAVIVSSLNTLYFARVDLVMFPNLIFSLVVALGLRKAYEWSRGIFGICLVSFLVAFVFAIQSNRMEQRKYLPYSLMTLRSDIVFLYGEFPGQRRPTISIERRREIEEKFQRVGFHRPAHLKEDFMALADRCEKEHVEKIGPVICVPDIRLPEDFKLALPNVTPTH